MHAKKKKLLPAKSYFRSQCSQFATLHQIYDTAAVAYLRCWHQTDNR